MSNGYVLSDEQLKTDITPIENASDLLGQLSSNSYFFNQDQSQLNLEASLQYGLLAQEIEEILPSLVTTVTTPTKFNDAGEVVAEPFTFKAVRYNDFIALLIAGFNEQQVAIGAQAAEIAEQTTEMELKNQELELLQNQLHEQDAKIQAMEKK